MNNEYDIVQEYLKELFESDTLVNLVTRVPFNDIGMQKNMLYPFVNIDYISCSYLDGKIIYKFNIYALAKRDTNKTPIENWDKWLRNDNELDNYNTCVNIANRLFAHLKNYNEYDIELVGQTTPEIISLAFMNMLDGCKFQIELAITNETDGCD